MRALRYHEFGGPEVLQVEDVARPEPGEDEVLVAVHAAGVNPVDVKVPTGVYHEERAERGATLPRTPGTDFAGVVEVVGGGVSTFAPGDRVVGTGLHKDRQFGSHAEFVTAPIDRIARVPDSVSFETAGAIALAGATAWRALVHRGRLTIGETCLIHGGSGGVGHVAVQIAVAAGATVIATAGSTEACDRVESLGAHHVFQYDDDQLAETILAVSEGGVDVILDLFVDEYSSFNLTVANPLARIVVVGGQEVAVPAPLAKRKELTMHYVGISNLNAYSDLPTMGEVVTELMNLVETGAVTAEIAGVYSLEEAPEAYRRVREESFVGKLVVVP